MIKQKYLSKIQKCITNGGKGMDLTKALLYSVAFGEKLPQNLYANRKISQGFSGLRRYKFIRRVKNNNYVLTSKGKARLQYIIIDDIELKDQKHWNGKWYLVMYDLPIRFKKVRNALRWKLKDLGFFQFQKSAWIYPYPCKEEILFVADFFGVRKYIEILEVHKILDDRKLKAHFDLS
jgi:hypothetical protein